MPKNNLGPLSTIRTLTDQTLPPGVQWKGAKRPPSPYQQALLQLRENPDLILEFSSAGSEKSVRTAAKRLQLPIEIGIHDRRLYVRYAGPQTPADYLLQYLAQGPTTIDDLIEMMEGHFPDCVVGTLINDLIKEGRPLYRTPDGLWHLNH